MASKFEKNYTDKEYLMKYEKLPLHSYLKNQVLQFSLELQGIDPKIWRRIHVPSDYNFWDLHVAIQDASYLVVTNHACQGRKPVVTYRFRSIHKELSNSVISNFLSHG